MNENARFFLKKLLGSAFLIFVIATLNFSIIRLMPGDAVMNYLGENEYYRLLTDNPARIEEVRHLLGEDKTMLQQYFDYLNSILHLDFGYSYVNHATVLDYVLYHLRWTLLLAIPTLVISAVVGGVLGLYAGWHAGSRTDRILSGTALALQTIPSNFVSILFMLVFAFRLRWFPLSGMTSGGLSGAAKVRDVLWHMALPMIIMVIFRTAGNFLHMKSYSLHIRSEDYTLTALAKGIPENRVMLRHGLRNAMLPYTTMIFMQCGHLLGGSMMMEVIFSWQGMGTVMYTAAQAKDYPILQFGLLLTSTAVVFFNLLSDVLNRLIDPRIGREGRSV